MAEQTVVRCNLSRDPTIQPPFDVYHRLTGAIEISIPIGISNLER